MAKTTRKELTKLTLDELKVISAVMYDHIYDLESEIADSFRDYFTTRSFYEILSQVVDCYLFENFPNDTQAIKAIKDQHRKSERDLKSLR